LEKDMVNKDKTNFGKTKPEAFIERYCSKLNISQELVMVAKFVAKKLEAGRFINDNTPHSVAAGVIYFVSQTCGINVSKTDIRKICGVSEVTINKCFKKMDAMRDSLIPKAIISKYKQSSESEEIGVSAVV
jgi:transcription initiation factor TFIIIB Brf1 subunit/transcription initiation factor TFIIB